MPLFLLFLLKLLASTVVFVFGFRLFADTADRLARGRSGADVIALGVRLVVVCCWAGWVAALVTATTRQPEVRYDWFYYLVTASLFLGPFGVMGRKSDARGASRAALLGGLALLALCLWPDVNRELFGWLPWFGG